MKKKRHWFLIAFWVSCGTFFLIFLFSVIIATTRKSGVTGIDAGQIQKMRFELNNQALERSK